MGGHPVLCSKLELTGYPLQAYSQGDVGYNQEGTRADAIKRMTAVVPGPYNETVLRRVCTQPAK